MIKTEIRGKGLAAFISLMTGKSGKITPTHITFEFENEHEIETLERKYAESEFSKFNYLVMTYGKQQRQMIDKYKGAINGTFSD